MKTNLQFGYVPMDRFQDAIARILSVKMALGLVQSFNEEPSNMRVEN